jgi:ATP-binding cassette subfamily C protein
MKAEPAIATSEGLRGYLALFRRQPFFSGAVVVLTLLGMLTDGLGLITLLPLLDTLTGEGAGSALSERVLALWQGFGLQPSLTGILIVYLVLMALRACVRIGTDWAAIHLRTGLTDDLRNEALSALMRAEWRWLSAHKHSDQTNMLLTEVQRVASGVHAALALLASGAAILVYLIVAFGIAPMVAGMATVIGGLMLLLFSGQRRKALHLGLEQVRVNRRLHENAVESMGAIKLAKILGTEAAHNASFGQAVGALRQNQIRNAVLSALSREMFQFTGAVLVAGYVFLAVQLWHMALAQLLVLVVIFIRLIPMLTAFQQHLHMLTNALPALQEARTITAQARAAAEPPVPQSGPPIGMTKEIALEGVSISFTAQDRPALRDISLSLPARSITVITGPSGSGKSTLADVLMGLLRPDKGQLRVDGTVLSDQRRIAWRNSVSYVPQEVTLYSGTIRENLLRGNSDASDADIDAALVAASADFVRRLPEGIETPIGDGAHGLSGGEKQRLSLARGLLRNPALLVLDEVTSALDPQNEAKIRDSLAKLSAKLAIVILGHRSAFLDIADKVIDLQDGALATGTHGK